MGASGPERDLRRPILGLTSLAAIAAFAFIGSHSLWMDEALTAWAVRVDFGTFSGVVPRHSANLGLYYLLMRAWSAIGTGEAALRAFSAVWAVATIPLFVALARRLAGRRVALIGGLLLAVQPFLISLAQEARPYTLVAFLATASTLAFVRGVEEPSRGRWIAYTGLAVLGVYAHAFAGLMPVAHAVSLAFLPRGRIPWRHVLASAAAGAIMLGPLAVASASQAAGLVDWIPALGARWISENVNSFTQGQVLVPSWLRIGQLVLYAVSGALGVSALAHRAGAAGAETLARWRSGLILLWAGLPMLLVLVVSLAKPLFVARYLAGSLPAVVLVAAAGLASLRPAAGRVAVATLMVTSAIVLGFLYTGPDRENWRDASRYLAAATGPGDVVMVPIEFGLPEVPLPTVGLDYYAQRVDPPLEASLNSDALSSPLWVVTSGMTRPSVGRTLQDSLLREGYVVREVRRFGGLEGPITVVRFEVPER